MKYITYNTTNGQILSTGETSEKHFKVKAAEPDQAYIALEGSPAYEYPVDGNYYVDITSSPHTIVARSPLSISLDKDEILADGVDECHFTNIPAGTQVDIGGPSMGDSFQIDDGELDFSSVNPGIYYFWFYKDVEDKLEEFKVLSI